MTDKQVNDILFDAALKIAVTEAFEAEIAALPSCEELDAIYPSAPEMDKRIERLINSSFRNAKLKSVIKGVGRAAAVIAIIFAILTVTLLSVEASRNAIFNTVVKWQERYTEITFEESSGSEGLYRPSYLPEGFTEISVDTC